MILEGLLMFASWLCLSSALSLGFMGFSSVISTLFPVRIDLRSYYEQKDKQIKKAQELRKGLRTQMGTELRTTLSKLLK